MCVGVWAVFVDRNVSTLVFDAVATDICNDHEAVTGMPCGVADLGMWLPCDPFVRRCVNVGGPVG